MLDFVVCMVVRNDSTRVQATSPSSMRLSMMLMPYSSLMRLSLYQTMHSSSILVNPSMVTPLRPIGTFVVLITVARPCGSRRVGLSFLSRGK